MGEPKFPRKQYETPLHPWKEERIKQEREYIKKYGLKNHKEVWRAKTYLGKYRQQARELLARLGTPGPQIKRESDQLLLHLTRMGILPLGGSLDDILALETESVLSRRLQTLVYLKGFASTASQSRQLINHGHIKIGERKVTIPGYLVSKDEEEFIGYTSVSPLNEISHPARPKTDMLTSEPLKTQPPLPKTSPEQSTKPAKKPEKPPSPGTTPESPKQESAQISTENDKSKSIEMQKTIEKKPEEKKQTPPVKPKEESSPSKSPLEKQEQNAEPKTPTSEKPEEKKEPPNNEKKEAET